MIFEKGEQGHGEAAFWEARLAVSELGVLVVGTPEQVPDKGYKLWFSEEGENWVESVLGPPGRFTSLDLWVVSPTTEGFLLAGVGSTDVEGDREVIMWVGDGVNWDLIDDRSVGLPGLVSEFVEPFCPCGSLDSVVPFGSGFLAAGHDKESKSKMWKSSDGVLWEPTALSSAVAAGVVGLATLGDRVFAVGMAPGLAVWRSGDGETWEVIADGSAFGLPGIPSGIEIEDNEQLLLDDALATGQSLALTSHDDSLLALLSIRVRFGDDWCEGPIEDCSHSTLALFRSLDGVTWERLWLPEESRWNDIGGRLAAFKGRLLLAEAGDGRLQVWASEDPAAPGPIEPDLGAAVDPGAFVAFKIRLNAEAGGYRALDLQGWTGVEVSEDGWEPVSVTLAGVQTEVTAVIEAGSTYVGSGGVFKPATSDVRRVAMPHGSRHELRLDVAEPRLPPGLHMFLLEFPVWVTEDGNPEGDPDGIALLTVIYNVFDEERAVRVRDFCDVAIPLVDGRAPSESGFSRLRELAQSNLEDLTLQPLLAAIGKVQAEIARPITQGGFSTGPLVEAVSDACGRYDLYSVAAAS